MGARLNRIFFGICFTDFLDFLKNFHLGAVKYFLKSCRLLILALPRL